jgi:hypothetical protein
MGMPDIEIEICVVIENRRYPERVNVRVSRLCWFDMVGSVIRISRYKVEEPVAVRVVIRTVEILLY